MKYLLILLLSFNIFSQTHTGKGTGAETAGDNADSIECKNLVQSLIMFEGQFLLKNKQTITFEKYINELHLKNSIKKLNESKNDPPTISKCSCEREDILSVIYEGIKKAKRLSCHSKFFEDRYKILDKVKNLVGE